MADKNKCVQCSKGLALFKLCSEHGVDNVYAYVCQHADCPNYGLLQTGILKSNNLTTK